MAFALMLASPAFAQGNDVGEPLRLGPSHEEPTVDAVADPSGGGEGLPGADTEGIEVDRLDELDVEAVGPLDDDNGGFGANMWAKTPRRVVVGLLPRMPDDLETQELRDLARRLLLSAAAPPVRRQTSGVESDLLAMRADRLMALGLTDGLNELMRVVPRSLVTPALRRHRVEGLLLAHDLDHACQLTRNAVADSEAVFWQKVLAVCQLSQQQRDQATLTVSLLREQGATEDTAFFQLFDAVETGAKRLPEDLSVSLPELQPLHLALIEAGGLQFAGDRLDEAPARVLISIARSKTLDLETRARAAEHAAALGALPAKELGAIYQGFSFSEQHLAEAATVDGEERLEEMAPTRRRALLYQAILAENAPAVRAELLRQTVADGDDRLAPGLFLAMADLLAPEFAELAVDPDLAWFAESVGRALYASSRPEAAGAWLRMAQQEAIINPQASAAVTALWPYARLSGAEEVPANGGLGVWRQAQDGKHNTPLAVQQSLLRAAFDALGEAPDRSWVEIALDGAGDDRPAPPTALLFALEEAGAAGRRGETVLLSLLVLGGTPPGASHPVALGTALKALAQVGLEDAARRLAVETAVHNGI